MGKCKTKTIQAELGMFMYIENPGIFRTLLYSKSGAYLKYLEAYLKP